MRWWLNQVGCILGSIALWIVGAFIWLALGIGWYGAAIWKTRSRAGVAGLSVLFGLSVGLILTILAMVVVLGGGEALCAGSQACYDFSAQLWK